MVLSRTIRKIYTESCFCSVCSHVATENCILQQKKSTITKEKSGPPEPKAAKDVAIADKSAKAAEKGKVSVQVQLMLGIQRSHAG